MTNKKNNPFLTPEMKNLIDSLNKITDSYSGYFQTIFHSDLMNYQIAQLQEEIVKPYRQLFRLYTPTMVASLTESLSKMSEIMTATVRENITTGVYNNLNESLKQSLSLLELQNQFLSVPPELLFHSDFSNYSKDLGGLSEDDFVIVDDTTVKTYELPDSVYIPQQNKNAYSFLAGTHRFYRYHNSFNFHCHCSICFIKRRSKRFDTHRRISA